LNTTDNIDRKKDHIDLAFESATGLATLDRRFDYEPMLNTFPNRLIDASGHFLGKPCRYPIWVSSMTGGTGIAATINKNLATACKEFGLGMGLGSCRKLLDSDEYLSDFAVRKYIGNQPLYANLGIAQLIELIREKRLSQIDTLLEKLEADGLFIHINPIQEWMQPEGDQIVGMTPYQALETLLESTNHKIAVKEVGQGMGPKSLEAVLQLPIVAFEFGAYGGTNFAKLEALRDPITKEIDPICYVGHSAEEMIRIIVDLSAKKELACTEFIISGGVKTYLDGYYYNELLPFKSVYGQASQFLKYALDDYETLANYVQKQIDGYMFAMRYLSLKKS
jgi:isopentenyl-diphosphate delta-isomerase